MGRKRVVFAGLLILGLGVVACGDSGSPQSVCADCPDPVIDICERGVQECIDIGGAFVDECTDAILRACQGE